MKGISLRGWFSACNATIGSQGLPESFMQNLSLVYVTLAFALAVGGGALGAKRGSSHERLALTSPGANPIPAPL